MKGISSAPFGVTKTGEKVLEFTLTNLSGASAKILNYGGIVHALTVPDIGGNLRDVCLGYRTLLEYEENDGYLGATVGRYANRIGGAHFSLGGREYALAKNDGENHLHGGTRGFNSYVWQSSVKNGDTLVLSRVSPDMEEGYPGSLAVNVCFRMLDTGALEISYRAVCEQDTICNLTNHTYFNLDGDSQGDILSHIAQISASHYTPVQDMIPTGELRPVEGTPFDFRAPKELGRDMKLPDEQLLSAGGYDHNFVLGGKGYRECAIVRSRKSGIVMTVYTDMPGVQLYTGNFLTGHAVSKADWPYKKHSGFCLETQFFPDALAHENFPQPVLKAGEEYKSVTSYLFTNR